MSEETQRRGGAGGGTGGWFVSTDLLERITTEHGGMGTTPDDAREFIEQVGPGDTIITLLWLQIEEFRARMGIVLDNMEQYVAQMPRQGSEDMARECQIVLQEFVALCEAVGLVETHCILAVVDDDTGL